MKPDLRDTYDETQCAWKRCRQKDALHVFSTLPDSSKIMLCANHLKRTDTEVTGDIVKAENGLNVKSAIEAKKEEWLSTLDQVKSFQVNSQEDFDFIGELLRDVKQEANELEKRKRSILDPLNASRNATIALFKPAETAVAAIETELKLKVAEYELRLRAARESARAQIDASSTAEEVDMSLLAMEASQSPDMPEGITIREVWDFKILNSLAVPREYLCVDESFVREAIRLGKRDIPGIEIFKKQSVAVRA